MAVFRVAESWWTACVTKISIVILVVFCRHCCSDSPFDEIGFINKSVEAVLGDTAQLPCHTKPPAEDFATVVLWMQGNRTSPFCNFDNRKGSKFNVDSDWNTTVTFRLDKNQEFSNLTLKPVKRSHQGLYRCRVDFKNSRARFYLVNLTVIVPPQKLDILDDRGVEARNHHIGPYKENATVLVTCLASGGWPPPRVTWWKDYSLLLNSSELLPDGSVRNVLKLEKLTRNQLFAVYVCQASNNNLSSLTSSVTINMTLSPQSVRLLGADKPMSAGRQYEISCHVYGAYPSPVIKWSKGNDKLKNFEKSDSNDGSSTISRLTFTPEQQDDGRTLSCHVDTAASVPGQFSDSRKLTITYKPIAEIVLGKKLNSSDIVEGVDVYFECNVKSNNLPVQNVAWKLDGILLRQDLSAGLLITNWTLVLQKVSRRQSGLYSCVATNQEGDGESDSLYLDIKYVPLCYTSSMKEYGADRGEKVRVLCEVEANPPNVSFVWSFNNKSGSLSLPAERSTHNGTRSVIEFQPNSENDYGMLYCRARNVLGEQSQPCSYRIYPAGKPDMVANCSVMNQTTDSFKIKCFGGFDGGSRQQFRAEIFTSGMLMYNLSSNYAEFLVSGLQSGLKYDVLLYAFNSKGRSVTTELQETLVADHDKEMPKSGPMFVLPHPFLTILLVVVGVLILLTCCIVLTLRSHDSKRRKKPYTYKSKESLEKNPDIIPNKDDAGCALQIASTVEDKRSCPTKQTDISLILQSSYGTDMNSDFILHQDDYTRKMYKKKTSSLRRLNDAEITYAACDQPCPPFVTQETPLLSNDKVPFVYQHIGSLEAAAFNDG